MYIALRKYKDFTSVVTEDVLVFDTDDFSLELVSYNECIENNIRLFGLTDAGFYVSFGNFVNALINMDNNLVIRRRGSNLSDEDLFRTYKSDTIYASRRKLSDAGDFTHLSLVGFPDIKLYTQSEYAINGVPITKKLRMDDLLIMYMFKFMQYTVVRMRVYGNFNDFYTAVLNKSGVVLCMYDEYFNYTYGDRSLGVKIDTIMRY